MTMPSLKPLPVAGPAIDSAAAQAFSFDSAVPVPVAPRGHFLKPAAKGPRAGVVLQQFPDLDPAPTARFLDAAWSDLRERLAAPLTVVEVPAWHFVIALDCVRFAVNRLGGQVDVQELVSKDGAIRFGSTDNRYAIDPLLRLSGFWLDSHLVRWQDAMDECVPEDDPARQAWLRAVKEELQRAVYRNAHWRRLRQAVRQAVGLDSGLVKALRAGYGTHHVLHRDYNRLQPVRAELGRMGQENPQLAWLILFGHDAKAVPVTPGSDPVARMKRHLLEQGVGDAAWRHLTHGDAAPFAPFLERPRANGWNLLENWLRVMTAIRRREPLPPEVVRGFFNIVRAEGRECSFLGVRVRPAIVRSVLAEAESRHREGRLEAFLDDGIPPVIAWLQAESPRLDRNQQRQGWACLAKKAAAWAQDRDKAADPGAWESRLPDTVLGRFRVVPLASRYELWREGLAMRHCVGDPNYGERCEAGELRLFSVREGERRLATMELEMDDGTWQCGDVRGFANRKADDGLFRLGRILAWRYRRAERAANADRMAGDRAA